MKKLTLTLIAAAVVTVGCVSVNPKVSAPKNATLKTLDGPLVQAHRGGRFEYDDNAAGGFVRSLAKGIRGFETDVRFTKDHELVIMHDSRVNRTTDGTGVVEEMTLAEVKACRLKNCAEAVPAAAEIAEILGGRDDIFVEFELKAYTPEHNARSKYPVPAGNFYTPAVLEEYCRKLNTLVRSKMKPGTYIFTSFGPDTLRMMRKVDPSAPVGWITSGDFDKAFMDEAETIGCCGVSPLLKKASPEMVAEAHRRGFAVALWMVQNADDWCEAKAKGADRVTSDYPCLLLRALEGKPKKLVAMDLDATLCQHRSPVLWKNLKALEELSGKYKCIMSAAGNAPRVYNQMGEYPIDVIGNYGMQIAEMKDGKFTVVKAVTNEVDKAFFREKTDYLRKKYGYTEYEGNPLEFHASGMVTFGLLGTSPSAEHKVAFDPDRKKRRAMYKEVCEIFKDYSVYIGGSTSFDFAGKEYNKYDSTLKWAEEHGYTLDDIVFIGDDFSDGGGDSHVRIKGMDHIVITDYHNFANAVGVLLKSR